MLTISKVFSILCLRCLSEGIGTTIPWWLSKPISELFFQISARVYFVPGQTERRRKVFLDRAGIDQFLKQISKLSFQFSVWVCSPLGQSEGKYKVILVGARRREHIVRLHPRVLGYHNRWKASPFGKFEIILPLFCFFIPPSYK